MGLEIDILTAHPLFTLTVEHADANEVFRRFVTRAGTRAGAGAAVLGVGRVRSAAAKELIPVDVAGVVLVEAGAAIAVDAVVMSDANGRAVTRPSDPDRRAVVDGAAAGADIAVTGIGAGDELLEVLALDGTAVTAPVIHAAGIIRSTANLANKKLLVLWRPPSAPAGRALRAATIATGEDTTDVVGDPVPILIGLGD